MKYFIRTFIILLAFHLGACNSPSNTPSPESEIPAIASPPVKPGFTYQQSCSLPSMQEIQSDPV